MSSSKAQSLLRIAESLQGTETAKVKGKVLPQRNDLTA